MRRLIITLAAATFVAACSDVPSNPSSSLRPTRALTDEFGDPPPPPVGDQGTAEFDAFLGDNSEQSACSAHTTFVFNYEYFLNGKGNNTYLHMRIDGQGLDVAIHQTDSKIDAHGTINGPGFTFDIIAVLAGTIRSDVERVPSRVSLNLVGKLTTGETSCIANAVLTAQLHGEAPIP